MTRTLLIALAVALASFAPLSTQAATFDVSGWIPYWAVSDGVRDARNNLDSLTSVRPFGYSVKADGTLNDLAKLSGSAWSRLLKDAKSEGVKVIPTVMWSDTANIQAILSNSKSRAAHVKNIATMVEKGKYDGVDIDYEGKLASTKDSYSAFLKELKAALGNNKTLSCTIEARTPPDSLYTTVPKNLEYANDYAAINKYCDQVTLMTYDQQRADLKLNAARTGMPYYPVADSDWVKKVITLATKSIDKNKLVLGIATYGREVAVTVSPNWFQAYSQLRSVNPEDALDTADEEDVTPSRNSAGELSFTYAPDRATKKLYSSYAVPRGTLPGNKAAAQALAYANKTGKTTTVNMVWWSDATAAASKVALAKSLGLSGAALFKIDGNEDDDIWDSL